MLSLLGSESQFTGSHNILHFRFDLSIVDIRTIFSRRAEHRTGNISDITWFPRTAHKSLFLETLKSIFTANVP
jgi:hypothetical protein